MNKFFQIPGKLCLFIFTLIPVFSFADEKPNIVLIVADDLSPTLGCYGDQGAVTPHIDALAKRGVRFINAFCTTASCSPSRAVLLTGKHNHANGQYGLAHNYHHFISREKIPTLAPLLTKAGYRTARIGKFHVLPESTYEFGRAIKAGARNPVAMAKACRELFSEESEQPFFLFFCTSDPHRGGGVVESDENRPDRFGNIKKGHAGVEPVKFEPDKITVPGFLPDHPATRAELAQYYQSANRVDQGVGQLVAELEATGKLENTVIMFTSDHGMAFQGAKTTVYDAGLKIPLIVANPLQDKNNFVCDAMVSMIDLAPTILEFAQSDPKSIEPHGRSLVSILDKEHPEGWEEVYASHTFHEVTMYYPMRVFRNRDYKLIWNIAYQLPYPSASDLWNSATWQKTYKSGQYGPRSVQDFVQRAQFELYDIRNDPLETNNLAGDPEFAQVLEKTKEKLREFQKKTGDPWKLKWERE